MVIDVGLKSTVCLEVEEAGDGQRCTGIDKFCKLLRAGSLKGLQISPGCTLTSPSSPNNSAEPQAVNKPSRNLNNDLQVPLSYAILSHKKKLRSKPMPATS